MLNIFKNLTVKTNRLVITPLKIHDAAFVLTLFNTKDWLEFIGDRNIHSLKAAEQYIYSVLENNNACLWTICKKDKTSDPIGLVTLIYRDYLAHPDIGYALLPSFYGNGFAFEAVHEMINTLASHKIFEKIAAISLPNNSHSLNLLEKLNFNYIGEINDKNELLLHYQYQINK
jgi:ribosomal-protein-alanine N-acetyltransferase